MEVIILLGGVQALFFVLLLLFKKEKTLADKILVLWIGFTSGHLFIYYAYILNYHKLLPFLILLMVPGPSFTYLYGPFLFIYTLLLTSKEPIYKKKYNWHFVPFIVYNLILYFVFLTKGKGELQFLVENPFLEEPFSFFFEPLVFLSGPFYIVWTLIKLKKHRENIKEYFSTTDKINLNWLRILTGGLLAIWTLLVVGFLVIQFSKGSVGFKDDFAVFVFVVLYVFILGFYGVKQGGIFTNDSINEEVLPEVMKSKNEINIEKSITNEEGYQKSGLKDETAKLYLKKLGDFMTTKKPYLEPSLNLKQLSSDLEISTHHLTEVLNRHLGMSFFDYINSFRVEEVKNKFTDEKYNHLSLLGIALESGFNSKSSFNRVFKQQTGLTPSAYLKNNNKS